MNHFILDGRYKDLLQWHGINVEEVLKKAQLPGDALSHRVPTMTEEGYYRFLQAIEDVTHDPGMPIKLATTNKIEAFSPPVFASYCAKNGAVCIERLARHKRLIGPMQFVVTTEEGTTTVELAGHDEALEQPAFLIASEFVFLANILRRAAKEQIDPVRVEMRTPPADNVISNFLNCSITESERNAITFRNADLEIPFISYDEGMWSYFEPELTKRLAELDVDESTAARVRSALSELLPGGQCAIEDVAAKLGLSRRTLQRKLSEENTTFQKQLNSVRETLAIHYLRNTQMTSNDIAFLLGYAELNSFLRAFTVWTGKSVSEYRKGV